MRETDLFRYYAFGYNYHTLRSGLEGNPVHGDTHSLESRLGEFFEFLEELGLQVTAMAAVDLKAIRTVIAELPADALVDETLASRVINAINKLDATLDAELQLRSAFVVTPKRFHLDNLLKKPQELFAKGVFEKLPQMCQFDFAEACRCIAFGLPTAAAFHLMRGVEGALRFYYCSIVKRERVKKLLWNDMVDHLRNRRDAPPKPLMDSLDNIRVNFRNPTQHPDAKYDIDEAQDLLAVSIDVVNRMIRDVSKRVA